jgi:hypothetical protein
MSSEPRSIFTSQKHFTQSIGQRSIPPQVETSSITKPFLPPSPSPSPGLRDVHRQTGLEANSQEEATADSPSRRASSLDIAGGRVEASLARTSLEVTADYNSIDASLQRPSQSTRNEGFRIPNLPGPTATTHASKHPRTVDDKGRLASTEPPSKKHRPKLGPKHTLNAESFHSLVPSKNSGSPPSPLFFSHSQRQRPILPPAFSSEAAATMLNKARDEAGGVTTLKLARGSITTATSPPRTTSTPGSWTSIERSSISRSPDLKGKPSAGMQILGSVGIIELLEQDERPTFIIDVANPTNFSPGLLQIVFANAALRASESILDMVTGKADLDSPGIAVINDFPEFKAWALSFVKNGESLDICLPSFSYGGVTWSCSTLRKRLRLISASGNSLPPNITSGGSNGAMSATSNLSERARGPSLQNLPRSSLAESFEPSDYFGNAVPPLISTAGSSPLQNMSSSFVGEDENSRFPTQATLTAQTTALIPEMIQARYPENPSFDWTRLPMSAALPKHIQFARSFDWASTPLGPIESWSFDLRAMCNLIMGSPHPAAMYWGDDYT